MSELTAAGRRAVAERDNSAPARAAREHGRWVAWRVVVGEIPTSPAVYLLAVRICLGLDDVNHGHADAQARRAAARSAARS